MARDAVIVEAVRSPLGKRNGKLKDWHPVDLLAEVLNETTLADLPLGFWFAQQSAIYVFVILIFVYAFLMDRVDHEYGVQEEEIGWARKRLERRMQRRLTGEAPTEQPEDTGEQREVRRDE